MSDAIQRWWHGLSGRLVLSHLAAAATGLLALGIGLALIAPFLFGGRLRRVLEGGGGPAAGPPGPGGRPPLPFEPGVTAAFGVTLRDTIIVASLVALAIALIVSLVMARRIVRPVEEMASASRDLAAGHYAVRVPVSGRDELADLAVGFNDMAAALETTEQRRRDLIGDVAHELRTPVAVIEGYLEGLLDGVVEPDPELWARLHREAGRMRRLIDDLQELSRAEAGQIPLKVGSVAPAAIVRAAIDRLAPDFEEKGLRIDESVPASLPLVRADLDRAVQILTNFLTNALRYTPAPGTVRVTLSPDRHSVRFAVTDSGIGIAPEHLPHLFERFYRVDKSRSRAAGGSGIGLTVARALADAMGGRTWAESPGPGQGATFAFALPAEGRRVGE